MVFSEACEALERLGLLRDNIDDANLQQYASPVTLAQHCRQRSSRSLSSIFQKQLVNQTTLLASVLCVYKNPA